MRIRSILPEFYRSEDIAALDWHHRLLFIGLWSYVDDNGVGRDNPRLIVSDLFPLDGDSTESLGRVSEGLNALSRGGQIQRYEVGGHRYLFVVAWDKYQRVQNPGKERYPRPTCDSVDSPEGLRRVYGESPETLSPGEGEKGRRGEGEKPLAPTPSTPNTLPAVRAVDETWDALLDACHVDSTAITDSARGGYNRAVSELKRLDVSPEEIYRRAAIYRGKYPNASCTPSALVKHWADCGRPPRAQMATTDQRVQQGLELAAHFAREEGIA